MDNPTPSPKPFIIILVLVMLVTGAGAGFALSRVSSRSKAQVDGASTTHAVINTSTEVGSTDTKTFGDSAKGQLQKGGLGTEGTHKLIRDGGPSQTVYLVSSLVDLDNYVGKTVEVFGQTLKAQKAPWLMDVGRIKLAE